MVAPWGFGELDPSYGGNPALASMRLVAACILMVALTGCATLEDVAPADARPSPATVQRPVVVAVLDSGVNPYHAAFAVPSGGIDWPEVEAIPIAPGTAGEDWASRVDADQELWAGLQPATLYRIEGTRLMSISFGTGSDGTLVLDRNGHGTHTSSIVARDAPQVVIVMVQVDLRVCTDDPSCLADASVADAMEWVAEQPWIDVVSVSIALPGNFPDQAALHPDAARYVAASRRAWESGKLVVTCAGNDPSAAITDYFDGPPWIITVGGAQASTGGETTLASRGVDVAGNFSTLVASHTSLDETIVEVGTSLATPGVAATLAEAIRIGKDLPPPGIERRDALRTALNATAVTFSPAQWTPSAPEPTLNGIHSTTNPVLLEGPQMGWGYVDASMAPQLAEAASGVGASVDAASPRALWQERWQGARVAYWSSLSTGVLHP